VAPGGAGVAATAAERLKKDAPELVTDGAVQ